MRHKARLKRVEKKIKPADTLTAKLPAYLQDASYSEPVATTSRVIRPVCYLALDKNGEVYFHK